MIDQPWGLLLWGILATDGKERIELSRNEFLMVCAAVEFDRCTTFAQVVDAKRSTKSWKGFWAKLIDGARGLHAQDAEGRMTVAEVQEKLGCAFKRTLPLQFEEVPRTVYEMLESFSA